MHVPKRRTSIEIRIRYELEGIGSHLRSKKPDCSRSRVVVVVISCLRTTTIISSRCSMFFTQNGQMSAADRPESALTLVPTAWNRAEGRLCNTFIMSRVEASCKGNEIGLALGSEKDKPLTGIRNGFKIYTDTHTMTHPRSPSIPLAFRSVRAHTHNTLRHYVERVRGLALGSEKDKPLTGTRNGFKIYTDTHTTTHPRSPSILLGFRSVRAIRTTPTSPPLYLSSSVNGCSLDPGLARLSPGYSPLVVSWPQSCHSASFTASSAGRPSKPNRWILVVHQRSLYRGPHYSYRYPFPYHHRPPFPWYGVCGLDSEAVEAIVYQATPWSGKCLADLPIMLSLTSLFCRSSALHSARRVEDTRPPLRSVYRHRALGEA
ncbi:hypothetical protein PM082_021819 [Marasmius tenuissimus]|nr:hypothetical protein PM082_021819 [Marasmius tenuissimus]